MTSKLDPDLEAGDSESAALLGKFTGGIRRSITGGLDVLTTTECITQYNPETLTSWKALTVYYGTIFSQRAMWVIMFSLLGLSCAVAATVAYFVHKPASVQTDGLTSIVKAVSVSIAFLLGLFLSACLGRWWDTVKSLEALFGATKKFLMTCVNLNIGPAPREAMARGCVLSVQCLELELTIDRLPGTADDIWRSKFIKLATLGQIDPEEQSLLESVPAAQRSFFAWELVAKVVAEQRKAMPLDPVAYDRLLALIQDGVGAVSSLKTMNTFQLPFVYVHMLAFMVHLCNTLAAIGSGVTVGILLARARSGGHSVDAGAIGNEFVFLAVQVFFYQAFLNIGASLSYPVSPPGSGIYRLPLEGMCSTLDKQLTLMNQLANQRGAS